jgi:hypothetical protein
MEKWTAARSSGPADQPGTICIELSGGPFDGNPKQEHFHATVVSQPPNDPFNEDQRLAKGLNRLIAILRDKLNSLQSGNSTQS